MSKEVIITEILKRFKLDSSAIKDLKKYEYKLIYDVFSEIPPEIIDDAIDSFKKKKFKIKTVRTSFY